MSAAIKDLTGIIVPGIPHNVPKEFIGGSGSGSDMWKGKMYLLPYFHRGDVVEGAVENLDTLKRKATDFAVAVDFPDDGRTKDALRRVGVLTDDEIRALSTALGENGNALEPLIKKLRELALCGVGVFPVDSAEKRIIDCEERARKEAKKLDFGLNLACNIGPFLGWFNYSNARHKLREFMMTQNLREIVRSSTHAVAAVIDAHHTPAIWKGLKDEIDIETLENQRQEECDIAGLRLWRELVERLLSCSMEKSQENMENSIIAASRLLIYMQLYAIVDSKEIPEDRRACLKRFLVQTPEIKSMSEANALFDALKSMFKR